MITSTLASVKGLYESLPIAVKPETIVALKETETAHRPQLLPGGDGLLFTLASGEGAPVGIMRRSWFSL